MVGSAPAEGATASSEDRERLQQLQNRTQN
jgi:hypothetical protein